MNLKGFSGCQIELVGNRVTNTSSSPSYNCRLKRQKEKQKEFKSSLPFLYAPKVFSRKKNSFQMEYIIGKDFISFLSESSKTELKNFVENITLYISENLNKCETKEIDGKIFKEKIIEIYKKKKLLVLLEFLELIPERMTLPIGDSHGDLTLSNIIFKKNKLILIDFLDGFVETPLIDITKLRQDTRYKWSLDFYKKPFDSNKINISLDHLDKMLDKSFKSYPCYDQYYYYFQFLNFARILPYAKDIKKINYLRNILSDIITKL